jgi:RNA polymerase sigma factor (sigma-70 family)
LDQSFADIIQKCKKGNRAAQKKLYYLSKDRLKNLSLRYCSDLEDARDVVQNSYLKIFRNIKSFDAKKGNFESWSNRIVINEALQFLKKRKRIEFYRSDDYDSIINNPNLSKLTMEELELAITSLPDQHKIMLNMHYFDELSYTEMALVLGIKESSVRASLSRARRALNSVWDHLNK